MDHFVDPLFPPDDTSVYNRLAEEYPLNTLVYQRRPKEFKANPKLFENDIEPDDIKQGQLPD